MKLYVWIDPYGIDYGSSMIFAIAESLPAARKEAAVGRAFSYGKYPNDRIDKKMKLGKPDRIVKLPCAEWHHWEE